jgi:NADH-quinone oxidoreductase subunit E
MSQRFDFAPIDRILDNYPRNELFTIAILQDIQERYHYLPWEAVPYVARPSAWGKARL